MKNSALSWVVVMSFVLGLLSTAHAADPTSPETDPRALCLSEDLIERVQKDFSFSVTEDRKTVRPLTEDDIRIFRCRPNNSAYFLFRSLDFLKRAPIDYSHLRPSKDGLYSARLFTAKQTVSDRITRSVKSILFDFSNSRTNSSEIVLPSKIRNLPNEIEVPFIKLWEEREVADYFGSDPKTAVHVLTLRIAGLLLQTITSFELGPLDVFTKNCLPPNQYPSGYWKQCQDLKDRHSVFQRMEFYGTVFKYSGLSPQAKLLFQRHLQNFIFEKVANPLGYNFLTLLPLVDFKGGVDYVDTKGQVIQHFQLPLGTDHVTDRLDGRFTLYDSTQHWLSAWDPLNITGQTPYLKAMKSAQISEEPVLTGPLTLLNDGIFIDFIHAAPVNYNDDYRLWGAPTGILYRSNNQTYLSFWSSNLRRNDWIPEIAQGPVRLIPPRVCGGHRGQLFVETAGKILAFAWPKDKIMPHCLEPAPDTDCYDTKNLQAEDYTSRCEHGLSALVEFGGERIGLTLDGKIVRAKPKGGGWDPHPSFVNRKVKLMGEPMIWISNFRYESNVVFDFAD